MTWEIGFRDKVAIDSGRKANKPLTGLWISLLANVVNFLLGIFIMLGALTNIGVFGKIGAVSASAAVLIEGMYTGVLANHVTGDIPLNSLWWIYLLLPIPALLTCLVAYILGTKDKKLTGLFKFRYPESDRDPKQK